MTPPDTGPLGILLLSGGHERAHYAFMLAAGAAAIGRRVVVFATNEGCQALAADWHAIPDAARDRAVIAAGVAGLDELREAAEALGVVLMACESGLHMAGLTGMALLHGVQVAGIPSFLSRVGTGQFISL
jgi:peroxiredoxin family protein